MEPDVPVALITQSYSMETVFKAVPLDIFQMSEHAPHVHLDAKIVPPQPHAQFV